MSIDSKKVSNIEAKHRLLINQKFGKLTVVDIVRKVSGKSLRLVAQCQCECGKISFPTPQKLLSKDTISCGCVRNAMLRRKFFAVRKNRKTSEMTDMDWRFMR